MLTFPEFFTPNDKVAQLLGGKPAARIDFHVEPVDLGNFLEFYRTKVVDTGEIFEHENFNYLLRGEVVNNLRSQVYLYDHAPDGTLSFRRYNRLLDPKIGPVSLRVYNAANGWLRSIEQSFPNLVANVERYKSALSMNIFAVNIVYAQEPLSYHLDVDGFFGFRLHASQDNFKFRFRKIRPETSEELMKLMISGKQPQVNADMDRWTFPEVQEFSNFDLGRAFIIQSAEYLHYFETDSTSAIVAIYGTV